ncbi:hypothetical protein [Jeotgalibacillus terrae]|uniref:Uncharacterized protein n=1 Tax=Jeotgalibacillus terrae TaxID=587735 RepID=A0ABW5ZD63_9BACL|nr:hypothetical protein [Jeotgalibacillus terrae]MBM7579101.1 hypothetical protein [Jeotgalibacillus terrae]
MNQQHRRQFLRGLKEFEKDIKRREIAADPDGPLEELMMSLTKSELDDVRQTLDIL